jgi:hypothetical protein
MVIFFYYQILFFYSYRGTNAKHIRSEDDVSRWEDDA